MFEATLGSGSQGNIAIDDIRLSSSSCLGLADCNFEQGDTCSWVQETSDDFDWLLNSGASGALNTRPPVDHTIGSSAGNT